MIVFQPIEYRDYKRLYELEFKKMPCELIERGDFKIYFDDYEAHRAAELESAKMQILQYYNKWDPAGLIEIGAPRDEYYYEIRQIWNRIDQNTSTEELEAIIEEVTRKSFGNMYYIKEANILEIAKKIDSLINYLNLD